MTIKQYMESIKNMTALSPDGVMLKDVLMEMTEVWSTAACQGYFILAAKDAGVDDDTIRKILSTFSREFDDFSIEQAEKIYYEY